MIGFKKYFFFILLLFAFACQRQKETRTIPVDDFFKSQNKVAYRLSPDGKNLSYLKLKGADRNIYIEDLKTDQDAPDGWRMALKRMDARGMKLGEPVDDGKYVPLEIANLEPELKQLSDEAQVRSQLMNRLAAVRLWARAITQPTLSPASGAAERFSSSS